MKQPYCLTFALLSSILLAFPVTAHDGDNDAFTASSAELKPVHIDPEGQQAIDIKVEPAKRATIQDAIKATGAVQAAETQSFQVTPTVSGVVKSVFVKQGDFVRINQPLVIIHSTEAANALTELLNVRAQMTADIARIKIEYKSQIALQEKEQELSKQTLERQEALVKLKIAAQKDYLQAKNAYEQSALKLNTLKQKSAQEIALLEEQLKIRLKNGRGQLKIMGLTDKAITDSLQNGSVTADLAIRSPVTGTLVQREVTLGERVEPSKQIFSIVNLSPIWVMVDVFQEQISQIKLGQRVQIETPSKQSLTGKIENIGSVIDPTTKTLHVRIVTNNPKSILRPGMFVTASILLGGSTYGRLSVPSTAIVTHQERSLVFVKEDDHFAPVYVHTGKQIGSLTEILDGLSAGSPVVVQGATQLKAHAMLHGGDHHDEEENAEHHDAQGEHHDEQGEHHDESDAGHHDKTSEPEPKEAASEDHDDHHHGESGGARPEITMLLTYFSGVLTMLAIGIVWAFIRWRMKANTKTPINAVDDTKVIERVE
ncbi:MAG: efflux RND transporter periplasmic adaptor subunit [Candidatus Obscuribacterales bacterium]|nr:efflux RND transporter periplasmic adaptor subunit [Candidatus Obscuribacterales bacterium]